MTPEQRQRVAALFEAALEKESSQREAYLLEHCDDEAVRAEVKSLLEHTAETSSQRPVVLDPRYENLIEIGRGGMGIVYKAQDRETDEIVALKVLKAEIATDPVAMNRFKSEVRLAHQITHNRVCRIHTLNIIDGAAYISMEFVEGYTLRDVLKRSGGLRVQKGIEIASQICSGLGEAHSKGIIHRDLKPENIMIDADGNAKIMDFGIARSVATGTTQWTVIGTPPYMAPEQFQGTADTRSDIYSLGLVLYEIFTGTLHDPSVRPRDIEPTIPVYLEEAVVRCLKHKPADRFQSVDELEIALRRDAEVPVGERKAMRIGLMGLLLAVFLIIGFLVGHQWRSRLSNSTVTHNPLTTPMHHDLAVYSVAFSPDEHLLASASQSSFGTFQLSAKSVGYGEDTHVL